MASATATSSDTDVIRRRDSGAYGRDRRSVVGWLAAALASGAIAAAAFAHGKLWDYEGALKVLQERGGAQEKRLDKMDDKLDRILDRLGASKP